jgi:hypothetical protein
MRQASSKVAAAGDGAWSARAGSGCVATAISTSKLWRNGSRIERMICLRLAIADVTNMGLCRRLAIVVRGVHPKECSPNRDRRCRGFFAVAGVS